MCLYLLSDLGGGVGGGLSISFLSQNSILESVERAWFEASELKQNKCGARMQQETCMKKLIDAHH